MKPFLKRQKQLVGVHSSIGTNFANFSYAYNTADQLTTATDPNGVTSFAYTVDGQLGSQSYVRSGQSGSIPLYYYGYDTAGRLIAATDYTDNTYVSYVFDGQNNRILRNMYVGHSSAPVYGTTYLYDTTGQIPALLGEFPNNDPHNGPTWYVPGAKALAADQNGTLGYFAYDGLGSVRGLFDSTGAQRSLTSYDPYGQVIEHVNDLQPHMGYTGALTDESGMDYLNARTYNPQLGMFMSADPLEGTAANPGSFNKYGYVQGNPIDLTDPSGKFVDCAECGGQHHGPSSSNNNVGNTQGSSHNNVGGQQGPAQPASKYDWLCIQQGVTNISCGVWLDKVVERLLTGGQYSQEIAKLLLFISSHFQRDGITWNLPPRVEITFLPINLNPFSASIPFIEAQATLLGAIVLPLEWLNASPSDSEITVLAHEAWHQTQGDRRYSSWGEGDANEIQYHVSLELGVNISKDLNGIVSAMNAVYKNENISNLCMLRSALIAAASGSAVPVYQNEPLDIKGINTFFPANLFTEQAIPASTCSGVSIQAPLGN